VLCDVERRRSYDKWRSSGMALTFAQWEQMGDKVHHAMHWLGKKKTEPGMVMCDQEWHDKEKRDLEEASVCWQRDQRDGSDLLNKFRNYQI